MRSKGLILTLLAAAISTGCGAKAPVPAAAPAPSPPVQAAPANPAAPAAPAAPPAPLQEVTVGTLVSIASLPLFIADEKQMGAKHGIDFHLRLYQDPQQKNAAFAAGQFPVDSGNVLAGAQLRSQGVPVVFLYGLSNFSNRLLSSQGFAGSSMADLKGKKVALPSVTGAQVPVYHQMARDAGLDFGKEIQITTGPPPAVAQMLVDGKVDAVEVWDPATAQLLTKGTYKVLLDPRKWYREKVGDGFAFVVLMARTEYLQSNGAAAKGLAQTMAESVEWIRKNPEEAARIFAKVAKIEDPKIVKQLADDIPSSLVNGWNANTFKVMQPYLEWAVQAKMLTVVPGPEIVQSFDK